MVENEKEIVEGDIVTINL